MWLFNSDEVVTDVVNSWLTNVADFGELFIMSENKNDASPVSTTSSAPAPADTQGNTTNDVTLLASLDTSSPCLDDLDILLGPGSANTDISCLLQKEVEDSLKSIEQNTPKQSNQELNYTYTELTKPEVVPGSTSPRQYRREPSYEDLASYSDVTSCPNTPPCPDVFSESKPYFSDSSNGYPPSSDSRGPPSRATTPVTFPALPGKTFPKFSFEGDSSLPKVQFTSTPRAGESARRGSSTSTVSNGTETEAEVEKPRHVLRERIKRRRVARGESELPDEDDDHELPETGLTDADCRRMERRRASNRRAAAKCRIKKKIEAETREQELQQAEEQRLALQDERDQLREKVAALTEALRRHQTCPTCQVTCTVTHNSDHATPASTSTETRGTNSTSVSHSSSDATTVAVPMEATVTGHTSFTSLLNTDSSDAAVVPMHSTVTASTAVQSPESVVSPDSTTINTDLLNDIVSIISNGGH